MSSYPALNDKLQSIWLSVEVWNRCLKGTAFLRHEIGVGLTFIFIIYQMSLLHFFCKTAAVFFHYHFVTNCAATSSSVTQSVGFFSNLKFSCLEWVSLYPVFLSYFQTHQDSACAMRCSLYKPFWQAKSFPTCLTCRHGVMWECEGLELAGQRWNVQGRSRSVAAGAQPGPVCPSTACLSSSCGPTEPHPAPVPGHSKGGRRCGLHGSSGPVLPPHSPA